MRQVEHRRRGAIASGSTPGWVQKFWSSAETNACFTTSGIAGIRHEDAPLRRKLGDQPAIPGEHARHHRRLVIPQPVHVRQVGAVVEVGKIGEPGAGKHHHNAKGKNPADHPAEPACPASARALRGGWRTALPGPRRVLGAGCHQALAGLESSACRRPRCRRFAHAARYGAFSTTAPAIRPIKISRAACPAQSVSAPCWRRNASNGSNGRPRMAVWSPSTRSNRWIPRPSNR